MTLATLLRLVLVFGSLSLVSFGGGNAVLPAIRDDSVEVYGWLSDRQFADAFAIAQAAPGPSSLVVGLIGLKAGGVVGVGGVLGAVVATLAMLLPSSLLAYGASRAWERFRDSRWRIAAERGLAPITVGLVLASGLTVARASDHGPAAWAVTAAATWLLVRTRINPLLVMACAALLGLLGWV